MPTTREYRSEGSAPAQDLPVNPFVALRVSYGMLLGEDDFGALLGNPRGKHMLHTSWLHGSGVIWGFPVTVPDDPKSLRVGAGLAADTLGRELSLEAQQCLSVKALLEDFTKRGGKISGAGPHTYRLVAVFDTCPAAPVPALGSPCDLSREQNEYSRTVERVRFELRPQAPADRPVPYPRLRKLFASGPPQDPASATDRLHAFLELAARDATDLGPAVGPDSRPTLFPVPAADAPVTLATVEIRGTGEAAEAGAVDQLVRRVLLPTDLLQDLLGALRPPQEDEAAPPAPQIRDPLDWAPGHTGFSFTVTRPLHPGSVGRGSLEVASLGERAWATANVREVTYRQEGGVDTVIVTLGDSPQHDLVRVVVHGTGPTPVLGADLVPLAGLDGEPPGSRTDGRDAVIMQNLGRASS
jgi:hypothetical protein